MLEGVIRRDDAEILEIYRVAKEETAEVLRRYCNLLRMEHGPRTTHVGEISGAVHDSTVPGPVLTWTLSVRKVLMEPRHISHWVWTYEAIVLGRGWKAIARRGGDSWLTVRRAVFASVMYMAARRRELGIPLRPEA